MKQKTNRKDFGQGTLASKMGIGYLIAAAVFFFNPCINIVDLLPDFFGVLFLTAGLIKWSDLCPGIADAVQGLQKLKWVMLLKMLCMLLIPLVDDTYVLIFTFGFAVIELIYMLPAIGRIFDGLEYFGTRFNGRSIYVNLKNVKTLTYMLFVVKNLFAVLPELCSLSSFEYSGYVTSGVQIDVAHYKYALLTVGLIITAANGLMWLFTIIPYWKGIAKDSEFLERVSAQYDLEVGNNIGLAFRRTLSTVLTLFTAASLFFLNFWFDGMNVVPNFIGGILLTVSMVKLSKYAADTRPTKIVCLSFTVVSAASFAVSTIFSGFFTLEDIDRNFRAYDLYNVSRIFSAIEYFLMLAAVFMVIKQVRKLILTHLGPEPDTTDHRLVDIYTKQQREIDRRYIAAFVIFIVVFLLNIVYLLFRADIDYTAPQFWLVPFLANGIWWIYLRSVNEQLYSQIEYKYM